MTLHEGLVQTQDQLVHISPRLEVMYSKNFEVLDHLDGANDLLKKAEDNMVAHPNEVTVLYIVGSSASGKLTTAGQIAAKILFGEQQENEDSLRNRLLQINKVPRVHFLDYPMCLKELQDEEKISNAWGRHSTPEYSKAAILMKNTIAVAKNVLPHEDPSGAHLLIVKAPASIFLDPDRINPIIPSPDAFMIMLRPDPDVQAQEAEDRELLWKAHNEKIIRKASAKRGVVMDKHVNRKKRRYEVGNKIFKERVEEAIIFSAQAAKAANNIPDCPTFTPQQLKKDQELYQNVLWQYFNYLRHILRIPEEHTVIPINKSLTRAATQKDVKKKKRVHYFRELAQQLNWNLKPIMMKLADL